MNIPSELTLTVEDVRYLRHSQLSLLTGIHPSNFSAWDHKRMISERTLERASRHLRMGKPELLQGFELRRQDAAIARAAQAKANRLIQFLATQAIA